MAKRRSISISNLRQRIREFLSELDNNEVVAITQHKHPIAYIIPPAQYLKKYKQNEEELCPMCKAVVALPPRFRLAIMKREREVKAMTCPHCYNEIWVVRTLVPIVNLTADKPRGFENIESITEEGE